MEVSPQWFRNVVRYVWGVTIEKIPLVTYWRTISDRAPDQRSDLLAGY
jgi:hypothetical protein